MKKILFILALVSSMMVSCSGEDKEEWFDSKEYIFEYLASNNEANTYAELISYNKAGDIVGSYNIKCEEGKSMVLYTDAFAEKVKVRLGYKWVQKVFHLNNKGVTKITVDDNTPLGDEEP